MTGGSFARVLIFLGLTTAIIGGIMLVGGTRFPLGRLPGDIRFQRGNFGFYFPVTTSILISLIISLLVRLLGRR